MLFSRIALDLPVARQVVTASAKRSGSPKGTTQPLFILLDRIVVLAGDGNSWGPSSKGPRSG